MARQKDEYKRKMLNLEREMEVFRSIGIKKPPIHSKVGRSALASNTLFFEQEKENDQGFSFVEV